MSTDLEAVATRIMRLCNESSECPFCGNDDGEHDETQLCADLDKALNPVLPSPSGEELVERVAAGRFDREGATVGGDFSIPYRDLAHRCEVLLAEEQEKPLPDTALIGVLCETVRMTREKERAAIPPSGALGLAQSLRFRIEGIVGSVPEPLHRLMMSDARALVAMLERREA